MNEQPPTETHVATAATDNNNRGKGGAPSRPVRRCAIVQRDVTGRQLLFVALLVVAAPPRPAAAQEAPRAFAMSQSPAAPDRIEAAGELGRLGDRAALERLTILLRV